MSHRALGPQFPAFQSSSGMLSMKDQLDQEFEPHWEDHPRPDCHYCGETSHTSTEHEVQQGWPTMDEGHYVSKPRFL